MIVIHFSENERNKNGVVIKQSGNQWKAEEYRNATETIYERVLDDGQLAQLLRFCEQRGAIVENR